MEEGKNNFQKQVDEVLKEMFGENGAKLLLRLVEKMISVTPAEPTRFLDVLKDVLGTEGMVIKRLSNCLGSS